ncbi:MAG TPA: amylo-alpha-1,6-glucosidase [Verrucomicrobiae bacterium]
MQRPQMTPAPGERLVRFVGDRIRFRLQAPAPGGNWRARLRTNLGRAHQLRAEIVAAHFRPLPLAGASWRDIPMQRVGDAWELDLPLTEVGYFKSKAYLIDEHGNQHWPDGADFGLSVQPDWCRSGNTIYCAFPRMFGAGKTLAATIDEAKEAEWKKLDAQGYTIIPPSGKLRDLVAESPHIFETLNARILHLLPVNPTPTTYARFGRYGSPYACEDLTAIDPALVVFDKHTTGVDQFNELTSAVHARGGRVFLDIVLNHTGWGSWLQENHPEWFVRKKDGEFESPGAWGTTWEDLVELDQRFPGLWEHLAEALLTWCRRGVDGFRCDAGYKIPMPVWQYITARVHQEFPDTVFLLEGLGGGWDDTANLLNDGGMQWAYSELFQNFDAAQVSGYLDHCLKQSERVGLLIHYSETHDNNRLAAQGKEWSRHRNRLSAMTSVSGGFGFTCGVEWLAAEKVNVHSSRGMNWNATPNLIAELSSLNQLLADHPCFFDNAKLTRLSAVGAPVYALRRDSNDGKDSVLILANTDQKKAQGIELADLKFLGDMPMELTEKEPATVEGLEKSRWRFELAPGAVHCLAAETLPRGLGGPSYRRKRAQAALAYTALSHVLEEEEIGPVEWPELAAFFAADPVRFLTLAAHVEPDAASKNLIAALRAAPVEQPYSPVIGWTEKDAKRVVIVPPHHWLLVEEKHPFRAWMEAGGQRRIGFQNSVQLDGHHIALFRVNESLGDAVLKLERFGPQPDLITASVRCVNKGPVMAQPLNFQRGQALADGLNAPLVLLTNGRGSMTRMCVDLGRVKSKYDCVLGASLHSEIPVDRHVFLKRLRLWVNADGFITPLDASTLMSFEAGPPAHWRFLCNAGDGRAVEVHLVVDMLEGRNAVALRLQRSSASPALGRPLPRECDVRVTARFDIEDRNFHWETTRNGGADHHFASNITALKDVAGFVFKPANDRQLRVTSDTGSYHPGAEWSQGLPHPVEASRGQSGQGDSYSPGWFDLPLKSGVEVNLLASAELDTEISVSGFIEQRQRNIEEAVASADVAANDAFGRQLAIAAQAYLVKRGNGKTVIAGYPWFLDWGRDSLIAARGYIAAGCAREVMELVKVFGRFEKDGTLPNTIHGEDASNRDTTDAPLWYGVVCEDLAAVMGPAVYTTAVDAHGRTVLEVLRSIAAGYLRGTANGIRVDAETALVWSPSHFTWMDTNYPAGTPREGYPIEIQALWIRLLRLLEKLGTPKADEAWGVIADRATKSLEEFFWNERLGWYADCLRAPAHTSARQAAIDTALRSNCVLAISLGVVKGERARRCVEAVRRWLVVPGALRSLAPLNVDLPLPIHSSSGWLLNDPANPYWGKYEGDEDTRRKPSYHNGTAWTWTFPGFCEAVAVAWNHAPDAVAAARAYLGSMDRMMMEGCIGQIPEVIDGDAPHQQRGCDAQAWGVTEALRVWKVLKARM